ncbi:hypothetical protein [Wohlfahrtiimonas larvae]|nr:hypothetical protein [Wohlfahrtiimonas larvae]
MIKHPVLGDLVYEEVLKGYVGSIELSEMPLKINLVTEAENIEVVANQLIDFLESDEFENAFIAGLEQLLMIKNRDWLNDGEAEYTLEELFDFVSLDAIVMYVDKIELYTDDLELLWRNRAIMKYNQKYQLISVEVEINEG